MRVLPLLVALLLGGASAFAVSCGGSGDRSNLIPAGDASDLNRALDQVASATKAGNCTAAGQAVAKARGVLIKLPAKVDKRLKTRLESGIANLRQRVPVDCQKTTSTPAPTTTQAPPAQTATQAPTPTQTTTPDTTSTPTATTPPPTTSTPTATTPGDTSGGAGVLP